MIFWSIVTKGRLCKYKKETGILRCLYIVSPSNSYDVYDVSCTECIAVFNNIYKETKQIPTKQIVTISMPIFEMLLVGMR